jgi:predicted O-methyltransferase YrrM
VHYECKSILELGTSLGLTSLYLSAISKDARVLTVEGDEQLASLAEKHFQSLRRKNITLFQGSFEKKLPLALNQSRQIDLAYFDGNHRYDATMNYFKLLLPNVHEKSIVVIGDIHWSIEMKKAWKEIISSSLTTLSIDLFYFGIVFFRKELSKQNFKIRW